jgi:hypothetical protein
MNVPIVPVLIGAGVVWAYEHYLDKPDQVVIHERAIEWQDVVMFGGAAIAVYYFISSKA